MSDFRKIVSSFTDGRIRLRHERLKQPSAAGVIKEKLSHVAGCHAVECNPRTGSVLVLYDAAKLSRDDLIKIGQECAELLDDDPSAAEDVHTQGTAPPSPVRRESLPLDRAAPPLDAFLAGRGARRAVSRGMLVSLSLTFVFSLMGRKSLHIAAGSLLGLLAAAHIYRHRGSL